LKSSGIREIVLSRSLLSAFCVNSIKYMYGMFPFFPSMTACLSCWCSLLL
jgi:hypothetical protein